MIGARKNLPERQHGAVLLVGLITLLVLTIIGLHASRSSTMGLIAATNAQESALALAAAEDSVAAGERRVIVDFGGDPPPDLGADTTDGFYDEGDVDLDTFDWNQATGVEREFEVSGALIAEYVIEYIDEVDGEGESISLGGTVSKRQLYRISGRGTGARGSTRVVQTIFAAQN